MDASRAHRLPTDDSAHRADPPSGPLQIDPVGRRAYLRGRPLALRPKEFLLLSLLAERAGHWVPITTVVETLACDGCSPRKSIVVHLCRVRAALGDGRETRIIQSARRLGYRLDPAVLAGAAGSRGRSR
ncbi:MAG: winged helix-turn-helix domain-containing protein [Gammaproteobacteria bacterium]|jgi:DNA-binding response OmpR family regulator